jgi:amino acid permease
MIDNSPSNMHETIGKSVGIALGVYEIIGVLGYLTFGKYVGSNIIGMYPVTELVNGGQLAIAILVLLSFPLQLHPCRSSLYKVLAGDSEIPRPNFIMITTFIMFFAYLIAITGILYVTKVHDLKIVLSIVGATGSTTICYILPGLFYYRMKVIEGELEGREGLTWFAIGLAILGCIVMVGSLLSFLVGSAINH